MILLWQAASESRFPWATVAITHTQCVTQEVQVTTVALTSSTMSARPLICVFQDRSWKVFWRGMSNSTCTSSRNPLPRWLYWRQPKSIASTRESWAFSYLHKQYFSIFYQFCSTLVWAPTPGSGRVSRENSLSTLDRLCVAVTEPLVPSDRAKIKRNTKKALRSCELFTNPPSGRPYPCPCPSRSPFRRFVCRSLLRRPAFTRSHRCPASSSPHKKKLLLGFLQIFISLSYFFSIFLY